MGISVNTSKQQVTAAVTDDKVTATVSSGFGSTGPQGGSGVVAVSAPITNSGTNTSANIGLSVGAGLQVASGNLAVTYGSSGVSSCVGNDARLSDSREWSASTVNRSEAEGGTAEIRRAWTAQRVFQAIASWWSTSAAKTKLDGIATGATANATDAQLRDRATHTGTQASSTISDFASAVVAAAPPTTDASLLTEGTLDSERLPASGVDPGTYSTVTVDATGRVTEGATHSVSWDDVGSKPEEFPPSAHDHVAGDIDSESATAGYVLTADGDGGASWGEVDALPAGTAGDVLTFVEGEWAAAAPAAPFDQTLNKADSPRFQEVYATYVYLELGDGVYAQFAGAITTDRTFSLPDADGTVALTSDIITSYNDLDDLPTLFDGSYNSLTDVPDALILNTDDPNYYGLTVRPNDEVGGVYVYNNRVIVGSMQVTTNGLTFPDNTTQTTAWLGTFSYNDLDDLPTLGTAAAADSDDFAAASHAHAWSDITSGVPSTFAPSAHKTSHATGGSDALTASDIGAAASSHTHAASDIASGTISTARLGSGTASSSTFLRGDNTWATAGSTSASDLTSGTLSDALLSNKAAAAINVYLFSNFR